MLWLVHGLIWETQESKSILTVQMVEVLYALSLFFPVLLSFTVAQGEKNINSKWLTAICTNLPI